MTDTRPELLFLAHRIPFPPNKGDKLRSFHLLRALCSRYRVHLGCFVDDEADWTHVGEVSELCQSTFFAPLRPLPAKFRALLGLFGNAPLTCHHFSSPRLQHWVSNCVRTRPLAGAFAFSSPMAKFLANETSVPRRVIDFIDVDSAKWHQYAQTARWPMRWIYKREGRYLERFEQDMAMEFDWSLFVSQAEAQVFLDGDDSARAKVVAVENGVDHVFFDPAITTETPFDSGCLPIVFTGAMDYSPNVDAVTWFAKMVFPSVRERVPNAEFFIVGLNPNDAVHRLAEAPGVTVTGRVPDVRPYIAHSQVTVAPLRIARGVQNKVLESLAMGKPVVASKAAVEGIRQEALFGVRVADSASQFIDSVTEVLLGSNDKSNATIRDGILGL
ncbi:MAG: sugar transferase (PEP-CTERM/EpsH1 system associated), partial [Gammaproteobacteria bacterium]